MGGWQNKLESEWASIALALVADKGLTIAWGSIREVEMS
jgi:hypothetical protein